jgi:hypothetical protein
MDQSLGRTTEPTTEADAPDARAPRPDVSGRVRDVPPSGRWEDTGIIDLDELQRSVDPLDPRKPGRATSDPLDPDGHVI